MAAETEPRPTIRRFELAKEAYEKAKARDVDMSLGPCLGVIKEGWVADVAHDPRQKVDDEPENQCKAYRSTRPTTSSSSTQRASSSVRAD